MDTRRRRWNDAPPMPVAEPHHFADCLIDRVRALGHPLCVGIDPSLERIPPLFRRGDMAPCAPVTADAVQEFCCRLVDLVADCVAVIKPQMALFEALGWRGIRALERVVQHARALRLLVVLDAKRGDIAATAAGYVAAYLGANAPLAVDAITVNPYLGYDTVVPFVAAAQTTARGVIVLVRNSNPGSTTYQHLEGPSGQLFEVMARSLEDAESRLAGRTTRWSSLGVTVGATSADDSERVRNILPHALFLVLGYGAQGGSAHDAVRGFMRGPRGLEGGIVNSSRPLSFPPDANTDNASRWEAAIVAAVRRTTDELGAAING